MKVLVTGGLGYIGSFFVIDIKNNHEVVIIDNIKSELCLSVLEKQHKKLPFIKWMLKMKR